MKTKTLAQTKRGGEPTLRFGKPSAPWFKAKKWFFDQDRELLAECHRIARLYTSQPQRTQCKNCEGPLGEAAFHKHGIGYTFCARCGHLNGLHQDSDAFCEGVYAETETDLYSRAYSSDDRAAYVERRDTIYRPKADFLLDALRTQGEDVARLTFADFGAGSGYFVSALRDAGIPAARGYDVSTTQIRLGNRMIGEEVLTQHRLEELEALAESISADVISVVFALEHVQGPRELLAAIARNKQARYAFIAVPLFSPCAFIEMAFPSFAHRHLACGHTHLYTEQSVNWMCKEFKLEQLAEWWFGADLIDIYRMIWMSLDRDPNARGMTQRWEQMMLPVIDAMQMEMDKRKLSSELHMVVRLPHA